ncbi:MAG TPA: flagellar biosynthesis protein FlhB [Pyrinomonadaceae bacterium]|nr:flagellar biosynthesis protein FlhB [Pyrinomonadaceae bacterium]
MAQGGEKTEQPTEKRLRDARRKGQVAKSQDLSSALLLIAALAVLWVAGGYIGDWLTSAMRDQLQHAASFRGTLDREAAFGSLMTGLKATAMVLAPLFGALVVLGVLVNFAQTGSVFSFEPVRPDMSKLNPAESFKQKFLTSKPYIELAKTVVKIIVTCAVVALVLWNARGDIVELTRQPPDVASAYAAGLIFEIGMKVGVAFLLVGGADFFLQRFLHRRGLRMSKHEVKEEYKETEGNPHYKSMRRRLHREILMQSVLAAVRQATVVVVNPTHVAVALRYDRATMNAPVVVAKGAELMAARIREIAYESEVPVTRDVPLARALYELEIDEEVSEELYEAVAVVLRWVYELAEERGEVGARNG